MKSTNIWINAGIKLGLTKPEDDVSILYDLVPEVLTLKEKQ